MENKPLYRIILKDAWRTTWEYKKLWFWGLFAGLLGNAGEYQILVNAMERAAGNEPQLSPLPPLEAILLPPTGIWRTILNDPFSVFVLLLVGLVIMAVIAFFLWLSLVSLSALVKGAAAARETEAEPDLPSGLKRGQETFVSVLVAVASGRLVNWCLISLVVLLAGLASWDLYFGLPVFLIAFILLVPASFLVSFVMRLAIVDLVLKRRELLESFHDAVALVRINWLVAFELAFILFVINILVGLGMVTLMTLTAAPLLIYALFLWQLGQAALGAFFVCLAVTVFLMILLPLGAMLSTFQWSAWTNLYLELKEQTPLAKIARLATHWFGDRLLTKTSK